MTLNNKAIVPLHNDFHDMNGNDFSCENNTVLSGDYEDNTDITNGIIGYAISGQIKNIEYFSDNFAVVNISGGVVPLCDRNNLVKFQCCTIEKLRCISDNSHCIQ